MHTILPGKMVCILQGKPVTDSRNAGSTGITEFSNKRKKEKNEN